MTRHYEVDGRYAKLLCNCQKVRLVPLEETQKRSKQGRFPSPLSQLLGPDSGQIEETLRPSLIAERCCECSQRKGDRIVVVFVPQSLTDGVNGSRGRIWPRS